MGDLSDSSREDESLGPYTSITTPKRRAIRRPSGLESTRALWTVIVLKRNCSLKTESVWREVPLKGHPRFVTECDEKGLLLDADRGAGVLKRLLYNILNQSTK